MYSRIKIISNSGFLLQVTVNFVIKGRSIISATSVN
jgi:hypothetical protein